MKIKRSFGDRLFSLINGTVLVLLMISIIYPFWDLLVGRWNAWFDASIYITKTNLFPLQVVLRRIILEGTTELMDMSYDNSTVVGNADNIKAATIFVCILPIICAYPFIQKYFVKGTMVGSIKG